MPDKIIHIRSLTPGAVPTTSSLGVGEIAINVNDGKIFVRQSGSLGDTIQTAVTTNNTTTGSVRISGSVQVTGSLNAPNITGSLFGTSSWALSASVAPNYLPIAGGTISGSLIIQNNLTVLGSASIQYISESTLNIGTNLITVNTFTPSVRFGGLAVIDSGSSPQVSASFLYDSVQDEFIFVHRGTAAGAITSSHFVLGPETYNNLGNENYLTANRIPKGVGNEHLNDSNISDDGSVVSVNSNTQITGSLSQGSGNTTAGIFSHAEGNSNQTGITTAFQTKTSISSGEITFINGYGDISSYFTPGEYLYIYDAEFGNDIGWGAYLIDTVTGGTPTIIQLVDTGVNTTGLAYVGDITYLRDNGTFGGDKTIPGNYAHSEGIQTKAIGKNSHAEGDQSLALGQQGHAEGEKSQAIGNNSHAEGYQSQAIGLYSHAEGELTKATGESSHAEGTTTISSGNYSHAEGYDTQAIGLYSHAEGEAGTQAQGQASHAEGRGTTAQGRASHAEGETTQAIGDYSHAEGASTQAIREGSHAEGLGTIASGAYQHVQGQYNISSSAQSAFIIGNGTDDNNRSNLVFASGSTFQVTGSLIVSGSSTLTNIGPAIFSGSLTVTQGITGSLFGTASTALSSSYLTLPSLPTGSVLFTSGSSGIVTGSSNLFWDNANGRLGIGTTTPTLPFEVLGTSTGLSVPAHIRNSQGGGNAIAALGFTNTNATTANTQIWGFIGTRRRNDVSESDLVFAAGGLPATTASIGMVLTKDRRLFVGEGASSIVTPTSTLEVSGSARVTDGLTVTGSLTTTGAIIGPSNFDLYSQFTNRGRINLLSSNAASTTPQVQMLTNGNVRMTIVRDGNVGIGTTNPSATLDISGSTLITGSLNVSSGITGSLFGTSSFALSASWAPSQAIDTGPLVTTSSFNSYTGSNTSVFAGTASFADTASVALNAISRSFGAVFDGGGSTIEASSSVDVIIPTPMTITSWTMISDVTGSAVIDIWKDTYANYPPTVVDSITGTAKPTITSADKAQSSTLTEWTSSLSAGDILRFNVDSCTSITKLTISIQATAL